MTMGNRAIFAALALALALGACGGKDSSQPGSDAQPSAAPAAAPAATGALIEIKAITDDQGNRFEPNEIEAKPGDVLRIVLVSGVHNISFPAAENGNASGLPAASDLLQLPGQTLDLQITMAPGHYVFQCDPHAALGMTGKLEVERE